MSGSMWIGDDKIGDVAAYTVSFSRSEETPIKRGLQGTIIFTKLDFDLFEKYFPRQDDEVKTIETAVLKGASSVSYFPTGVRLSQFRIWNKGWGWTEDELTLEFVVTWTASDFDHIFEE